MTTPKLFGFPLWRQLSSRVGKKHLFRSIRAVVKRAPEFATYQIGSVVNDCSGWNRKVIDLIGSYRAIPHTKNGEVLCDIELKLQGLSDSDVGYCSLAYCGIEPAKSQTSIEQEKMQWYQGGGQEWIDDKEALQKAVKALQSGLHIADENGFRLPGFP